MHKKILVLAITGSLFAFFSHPLLADDKSSLSLEEIKSINVNDSDLLPSINEIYMSTRAAKVTGDWGKKVKLINKNYKEMSSPERAFEVGKTLSDISFLVLDSDKAPSKAIQNVAFNALSSVTLSAEFKNELNILVNSNAELKGEDLRKKMDARIKVLLQAQESENSSIRDTTMTLLAASYFKAYYLAAQTVETYPKPTKEQLELFSWRDLTDYFINYFSKTASKEYQESKMVKYFLGALLKIKPIVEKPRDKITKEDVAIISKVLSRSFD